MMTETIYFDHNIYVNETNWEHIKEIVSHGLSPALSMWNVIELSFASDIAQGNKRTEFIESLNPVWMPTILQIQENEIKRIIYKEFYQKIIDQRPIFLESFPEIWRTSDLQPLKESATLKGAVEFFQRNPKIWDPVKIQQAKHAPAVSSLLKIPADKLKENKDAINKAWLSDKVPKRDPSDQSISPEELEKQIEWLIKNFKLQNCTSVIGEDLLYVIRNADKSRPPEKQDAIDGQHVCLAVSYCDYFITADGYAANCAEQLSKKLGGKCTVFRSPIDCAKALKSRA